MPKVISWNPEQWRLELGKRLKLARDNRRRFESQWEMNAAMVYQSHGQSAHNVNITFDSSADYDSDGVDESDADVGINYVAKYVNFTLGMLSSNPPSTIAQPTSPDPSDRAKADAGDRVIRFEYKNQDIQGLFDKALRKCVTRGSGFVKQFWDPERGKVADYNEESGEISMHGEIHQYSPDVFAMFIDPYAKTWDDVRYTIEEHRIPYEEALFKFPQHEKKLKGAIQGKGQNSPTGPTLDDVVCIYEYYEKAMPINGMAGRHAWHLEDGTLLTQPQKNPHIHGKLPYYLLTDLDREDLVYGQSRVEYVHKIQEMLNRFDSAAVDAMLAHACIRMLAPDGAEIDYDDVSTSNVEIIRHSGVVPPSFMNPGALPPDLMNLRQVLAGGIQELFGVNDSMLGVIKRETSGFSQQTAIESGNTNNRRFFNKYTDVVRDFWRDRLELIRQNWELPRLIKTLGDENAFEARDIKGADIMDGFDIMVDYGQSLPLDPNMRREQIMILMEPLKEAGVPMTKIIKMLKLNELDTLYDELDLAERRQREIFDEMIAASTKYDEPLYIGPEELENHEGMLVFCSKYRMTMEYKKLSSELKDLVEQHIRDRMEMAAQVASEGQGAAPEQAAPGPEAPAAPGGNPLAALGL